MRELTKPIRAGLEKFFIATDELEDKKLNHDARKDVTRRNKRTAEKQ